MIRELKPTIVELDVSSTPTALLGELPSPNSNFCVHQICLKMVHETFVQIPFSFLVYAFIVQTKCNKTLWLPSLGIVAIEHRICFSSNNASSSMCCNMLARCFASLPQASILLMLQAQCDEICCYFSRYSSPKLHCKIAL